MHKIQKLILQGPEGHMYFTHNVKLLEEKKYLLAGRLVGMSIVHGGPGLSCLDPLVYQLMCGEECIKELHSFDINAITADSDILQTLKEVCIFMPNCSVPYAIYIIFYEHVNI